jgi:hypothetical protein
MDEITDTLRSRFDREVTPDILRFGAVALDTAQRVAEAEGWYPAEAAWIAEHALPKLIEALEAGRSPEEALHVGLRAGRQALAVHAYEEALAQGSSRETAFLTLVETERRLAPATPDDSDARLAAACRAVDVAASEGASSIEQIASGFAVLQRLRDEDAGAPDAREHVQ